MLTLLEYWTIKWSYLSYDDFPFFTINLRGIRLIGFGIYDIFRFGYYGLVSDLVLQTRNNYCMYVVICTEKVPTHIYIYILYILYIFAVTCWSRLSLTSPLTVIVLVLFFHQYGGRNQGWKSGRKWRSQVAVIPGIRGYVNGIILLYFMPWHDVRFNAGTDNRGIGAGMVPYVGGYWY